MDIKYEIEPVFKIEFFKIQCINFKNKKKKLEKALARYPEMPQANFGSNRDKCNINAGFRKIFKDEFSLMQAKYNLKYYCKEFGPLFTIKVIIMCHKIIALLVIVVFYI